MAVDEAAQQLQPPFEAFAGHISLSLVWLTSPFCLFFPFRNFGDAASKYDSDSNALGTSSASNLPGFPPLSPPSFPPPLAPTPTGGDGITIWTSSITYLLILAIFLLLDEPFDGRPDGDVD